MVFFRSPALLACLTSVALAPALPALAGDETVSGSIGVGLANLYATETVHSDGMKISHLDWESRGVKVLRGALDVEVGGGWTVRAEGKVGIDGDGQMTDYDWVWPFYANTSKGGWSDRSVHGDNRLDHYYTGSIEISRRLFGDHIQNLNFGLGGRYTDVKWSAYGGNFIYSVDAPRDTIGSFSKDERGISYQQKIPVLYATLNGSQDLGRWRLTGALEAGATIKAKDVDDHWMRDLRFKDELAVSAMFGGKAGVEYKLTQGISLYLDGSFETTDFRKGNIKMNNTVSGETTTYKDSAAGSFAAVYIGTGIRGSF